MSVIDVPNMNSSIKLCGDNQYSWGMVFRDSTVFLLFTFSSDSIASCFAKDLSTHCAK